MRMRKKIMRVRERERTQENYSGSPIGTSTPFTTYEEIHYVRIFVTSFLTYKKIPPYYL
jgi:hypothetical protein